MNTLFAYPADIRKAIYTTNAIESLNSVIRQATKKCKLFPTDDSVRKVIYLAIEAASKKWNMPIRDWRAAMNRFMFEFEGPFRRFHLNNIYTDFFTGSVILFHLSLSKLRLNIIFFNNLNN